MYLPKYPVYVPTKGRYDNPYTIKMFLRDQVPFWAVVEPQEKEKYAAICGKERLLVLPWSGDGPERKAYCEKIGIENGGLIAARNWIRDHAERAGSERHWQIDDNITGVWRTYKGKRMPCQSGVAMRVIEDFSDRYDNVGIAGMNYDMFGCHGIPGKVLEKPFRLNCHVYSFSLISHHMPFRWRIAYNDDTDLCLQALASGEWCTIQICQFLCGKLATMKIKGGNTTDLYQDEGRLKMARSLERLWPGVVETKRRYGRPQHVIKGSWKYFKIPLKKKPGLEIPEGINEYGMELRAVKEVKSPRLKKMLEEAHREP